MRQWFGTSQYALAPMLWSRQFRTSPLLRLVITLGVIVAVVLGPGRPEPARAYCSGGTPISAYVEDNLGVFAWEGPNYPSTCDGDGYYAGALKDVKTDGYCVRVYFYDAATKSYEGQSCNTSGTAFNYVDRTGNTSGQWCVGKGSSSSSNWCLETGLNPFAWSDASGY